MILEEPGNAEIHLLEVTIHSCDMDLSLVMGSHVEEAAPQGRSSGDCE